ncbi:hypothetical protein CAB17_20515 [Legionella sainthelensi]|nr:hypothetical protein CAB17_20515 [Legionella sainthelensi]
MRSRRYGCTEEAKSLGVHQSLLSRWIREHQESDSEAFRGNGKLRVEQVEIRWLKEENKHLKMEMLLSIFQI